MVTEHNFLAMVDQWWTDVRAEALRLFHAGVAEESCVQIARTIVDAKLVKRARALADAGIVGAPRSPRN